MKTSLKRPAWHWALGALFLSFLNVAKAEVTTPQATIFVLVDLSETWHNQTSEYKNSEVLDKVRTGITGLAEFMDPPIRVTYLGVGSQSLGESPLCEITFTPKLISQERENIVSTKDRLDSFLTLCSERVLQEAGESLTDISGAIHQATDMVQGLKDISLKLIVILSDMKEERGGAPNLPLNLSGWHALVVYRVLAEDQRSPESLQKRLSFWKNRLRTASAESVAFMTDSGLVEQAIAGMHQ